MYFPTSLKLVGAVLLSALVANAAPAELLRIMTLTTLTDSAGQTVWSNPDGYNLMTVTDSDDTSQFNPNPSIYALYRVMHGGWMDDNRTIVNPAFGITREDGAKMPEDEESELKEQNVVITSGYDETGRYWVVRRRSARR